MRADLYVYNEATGWTLTSACLNGRAEDPVRMDDDADWLREVRRGSFIPLSLVQDDPLIVRVVVDEALSEQEAEEWVDHVAGKLAVPDGKLVVCGGAEFVWEAEVESDYLRVLEIPPGTYRADVYTQFAGVNGPMDDEDELKDYWKRTRKRERMPAWIREGEDFDEDVNFIDFVVHLTPLGKETAEPEELPLEEGWVPIRVQPRLPERCPRGLTSDFVLGLDDRPEYVPTGLCYVHNVPELVADLEPAPIRGGPVSLPLRELVRPYWLAWCTGETHPYVRVFDCPPVEIAWPGFAAGIQETRTEDGWRIDIEGMNARFTQFGHLRQIGELLAGLPDGAGLELACADNQAAEGDDEEEARAPGEIPGFHRYVGRVRDGEWVLEHTHPPVDRETLLRMLELAADAEGKVAFRVESREEGEEILREAKAKDFLLREKLPRLQGRTLKLRTRDLDLAPFLAAHVYLVRFGEVWPAIERDDDLADWDAAMDRIAEASAAWATGEPVFEGRFAKYTRGDLLSMEGIDREKVEAVDRGMAELGFELLGDLNSTQTFQAVFRGYGRPGSPVYGALIKAYAFGDYDGQFYTVFEDGWSLTTSAENAARVNKIRDYKTMDQGGQPDLPSRLEAHEALAAKEAAAHRGAREAAPTLEGFAAALDDYLARVHMGKAGG